MAASPETQPSLLVRIRNERDTESCSRFVEIYAPAVYRFLKQQELQDADAADFTQEMMASVAAASSHLITTPTGADFVGGFYCGAYKVRNFWRDAVKSPDARGVPRAHRQLIDQPDERHDASKVWQQEYEHRLFISASEQVRPMVQESTWLVFWNTAVDGESPASVAIRLNTTPVAVRLAKARVIHRIKQEIKLLEGEAS